MAKHLAKCPKCGHRVDFDSALDDHVVCAHCGARLRVPDKARGTSLTASPTLTDESGARAGAQASAPRPAQADPLLGQTIGQFEIVGLLGRGGMGAVYKARQASLGRFVAVKVLPHDLAADESFVARFSREAHAAAAINHPNIIEVYDVGEDRGHQFIAMEFIDGETLSDILKREGRLAPARALEVMRQVTAALAVAHECGILHRDIKPSNILIDSRGWAKVADFGLAKHEGVDVSVTVTGQALGTPLYMPPEAARGEGFDARSDLYSLGATFYQALTGRPPFEGSTPTEVILKHAEARVPPLQDAVPDCPTALCRAIHRLLRKNPADRYASADKLLEVLARIETRLRAEESTPTQAVATLPAAARRRPPTRRKTTARPEDVGGAPASRGRLAWILGGVAAALVLVVVLVVVLGRRGDRASAVIPPPSPKPGTRNLKPPRDAAAAERNAEIVLRNVQVCIKRDDYTKAQAYLDRFKAQYGATKFVAAHKADVAALQRQIDAYVKGTAKPTPPKPATATPPRREPPPDDERWTEWEDLFDGKTLNRWRIAEGAAFARHGPVRVERGWVMLGGGESATTIVWSGSFPREDYEVAFETMRATATGDFGTTLFPVGSSHCVLALAAYGGKAGLSWIDGKSCDDNATTRPITLVNGRWYAARLRVTAAKIEAWIDQQQVVDFAREGHTLTVPPHYTALGAFSLGSLRCTSALRNIRLRRLRPEAEDRAAWATRDLRAGIIGTDTSHAPAFAELLTKNPQWRVKVVAAFPGGSPDIPSSAGRVQKYAQDLRARFGVEIVASIEALLAKVDVVLIESVDGRPHLAQARPALRAGKPVFIDKPFTASLDDAREIVRLSQETGVPFFSSSCVRFQPELARFRRYQGVGKLVKAQGSAPMQLEAHHPDLFWYGIHGVEALYTVLGRGCVSLSRKTEGNLDITTGTWKDGTVGIFRGVKQGDYKPIITVWGTKGEEASTVAYDYAGLVEAIAKFFQTRQAPVDPLETLEIIEFMTAAQLSKERGGAAVRLDELRRLRPEPPPEGHPRYAGPWEKRPQPVLGPGPRGSWDAQQLQSPCVVKVGNLYHLYYLGMASRQGVAQTGLATSRDLIHWTKHPANPVIRAEKGKWDATFAAHARVLNDGRLLRLYYGGRPREIGYAESRDGIRWSKPRLGLLDHGGSKDNNICFVPGRGGTWDSRRTETFGVVKAAGLFHAFYVGDSGTAGRVGHATSTDGRRWVRATPQPVLARGAANQWDSYSIKHVHVTHRDGEFHMLYTSKRPSDRQSAWRIGLATSPDGSRWSKWSGNPVLEPGPANAWDGTGLHHPWLFEDETGAWLFYSGEKEDYTHRIGVARLVERPALKPEPPPDDDQRWTEWEDLFDGKTLNSWQIRSDGHFKQHGQVRVSPDGIRLERGKGSFTGILCTRDVPAADYELAFDVRREAGGDQCVAAKFPTGTQRLAFGIWTRDNRSCADVEMVDEKGVWSNDTRREIDVRSGRWYHLRVRVTLRRVEAWVDDVQVADLDTAGHKLHTAGHIQHELPLGLHTEVSTCTLRAIRLRRLKPDAKPEAKAAPWKVYTRWPFDAAEAKRRQSETAKALGVPVEQDIDLGNNVKLTLVLIPAGEFLMGSPPTTSPEQLARLYGATDPYGNSTALLSQAEFPQHRVRLSRPFWLGKCEVTQAQWRAVMGANLSHFQGDPQRPVERVNWDHCQAFARALGVKAGRPCRLPTEAEWEYACRAGTASEFYFGDRASALGEHAWYRENSSRSTQPVGRKTPNAWGLHDMAGNVWEWRGSGARC